MTIDLRELFPDSSKQDTRTINALLASIKGAFKNDFDYLNFKRAIRSLETMNMDEATKYKSAFITASTMGVTKQLLLRSAENYMNVLEKEKGSFADALKSQLEKKVDGKKDELNKIKERILENERKIKELKKENIMLQEAIDNADEHVAEAKEKIESTKKSFLEAFDSIYNVIKNDIDLIQQHL